MLSGYIYQKIDLFNSYLKWMDDEEVKADTKETIDSLEKVIPTPIPFAELDFNFGKRWMPTEYFEDYLRELLKIEDINEREQVHIAYIPASDSFHIELPWRSSFRSEWGSRPIRTGLTLM